ncbi:hypothetical protein DSM104443_01791 [Usitatibacter rugosus]|uniref:Uncharacterized protein n=2 Tax=Usitatibacter rugosus TaxID=2732067 RepID=A0A6M4GUK7_9PROT|nr:hypothetical protein DSM104443_01791 [Usitatibacter rugosus]
MQGIYTAPGTYEGTTTVQGRTATTSGQYTPGVSIPMHFPNHEAMIRLSNGEAPGMLSFNADSVYANLAPKHKK